MEERVVCGCGFGKVFSVVIVFNEYILDQGIVTH